MKLPLKIVIRDVELGDAVRDEIARKAEKLTRIFENITKCRVVVEAPHHHNKNAGIVYNVSIDLAVPGKEIVVKKQPNKNLSIAIREAFNAAYRELEDYATRVRGEVKHHEEMPHAQISKLELDKGYGFLTTPDGRDVYFHENSVINHDFKKLTVGTMVRFVEEMGEKGPQASSVYVMKV